MKSSKNIVPNLFLVVDTIEKNRLKILTSWVNQKNVKLIFENRKISLKKFLHSYAIPIIEYFIAVMRQEKVLDDNKIIHKFIRYMIKKNITPKEIFDICMGFRRVLIAFLLKDEIVLKNVSVYLDEISKLFDANLSRVLEISTDFYINSLRELAKVDREKLNQSLKIIHYINTKIVIVKNGRMVLANKPFLKMLGVKNLDALYLKYENGFGFLFKVDLYHSDFMNNISTWIEKVYKNDKPFQSEIYNEEYKKVFNYTGRITKIPGEIIPRYIITFSNISEHIHNKKELEDLLTHDEATGFKTYPVFERFIHKMINEAKEKKSRLFLAIADIPYLNEINKKLGREAGDMAIAELAEDLRYLYNKNTYFARLDGSRFGILLDYKSEQESYDWCVKLHDKMKGKTDKKTLAITEVDLSESINMLFIRAFNLIEQLNSLENNIVLSDFENIVKYEELENQKFFTDKIAKFKTLNITIYYKELPLLSEVKLVSVSDDSISVILSAKQMRIAQIDTYIHFRLSKTENINASIKSISKDTNIVVIDRFRINNNTPLNRKIFRVKVEEDLKAYIIDNDIEYFVSVYDINIEAIAVKIDRKRNLDIDSIIHLNMIFPLANKEQVFFTAAKIFRIDKIYNGYKLVLKFDLDAKNEKYLIDYISKHQMKIIHDFTI